MCSYQYVCFIIIINIAIIIVIITACNGRALLPVLAVVAEVRAEVDALAGLGGKL